MTDAERDELIEKSLLKQLNAAEEDRVQQLVREDNAFRQEYEFQRTLIQQTRFKRRQELTDLFAQFEADQPTATDEVSTAPVAPLSLPVSDNDSSIDSPVIPLWRQRWFLVAASLVIISVFSAVIWWRTNQQITDPIADRDSTRTQTPKDTQRKAPLEQPVEDRPKAQGPVAEENKPIQLKGLQRLRYYETDDVRLGFGEGQRTSEYRPVEFAIGPQPTYEFGDTLKIYLPTLPPAKPDWLLVYSRTDDTYYLIGGKDRYEVIKGLKGKQPLQKKN